MSVCPEWHFLNEFLETLQALWTQVSLCPKKANHHFYPYIYYRKRCHDYIRQVINKCKIILKEVPFVCVPRLTQRCPVFLKLLAHPPSIRSSVPARLKIIYSTSLRKSSGVVLGTAVMEYRSVSVPPAGIVRG
jgi:hypothetical protein